MNIIPPEIFKFMGSTCPNSLGIVNVSTSQILMGNVLMGDNKEVSGKDIPERGAEASGPIFGLELDENA